MNKKILLMIAAFLISLNISSVDSHAMGAKERAGMAQKGDFSEKSPFGVLAFLHWDHGWNNYKYSTRKDLEKAVSLMKKAGISWVRMDFLWGDIEPNQGHFDFDKYDMIVDVVTEGDIHILGILDYSTPWASSHNGLWNYAPRYYNQFVNYSTKVIERYKDRIKYWEVWNEPDSGVYWNPQDSLKSYTQLLKEVYIAAKIADPECKILNGGFAKGLSSVNHLYDNGGKDYFDIMNIHIFENPLDPKAIKVVTEHARLTRKKMAMNGDADKELWITEIGSPGVNKKVTNWWMDKNPGERQQAVWLTKVYTALLENNSADKIFWAFFRDCKDHWKSGIDYFGLVRWNYTAKPAYKAYRRVYRDWLKDNQR